MSTEGLFSSLRKIGTISSSSASYAKLNLSKTGLHAGTVYDGARYGLGEIGEFVLIECEQHAVFGRITEVRLPDSERLTVESEKTRFDEIHPIGFVQLLATVSLVDLTVIAGIQSYPRLGDSVFSSPHEFNAQIPMLMNAEKGKQPEVTLSLGYVKNSPETEVRITPEKLFGRHCAILGATGGGKSYTVSKILEESAKHDCKQILLDATGEYCDLEDGVEHFHIGEPVVKNAKSTGCGVPESSFEEQDFVSLFEPSGKVQGPKLREAIKSLKLVSLKPSLGTGGVLIKTSQSKADYEESLGELADDVSDPRTPFDTKKLVRQLEEECVYPSGGSFRDPDYSMWGGRDEAGYSFCLTLMTRIAGVTSSQAFAPVFDPPAKTVHEVIGDFLKPTNPSKILRICLSGIQPEYNAREVLTNAVGRHLLSLCREGSFRKNPVVVFLDEAHGFIGKSLGHEDYKTSLDAFEVLAKEGRKYGLNLCLATQRPRDIPEGVISQMGTLLVHRLTNERDRDMVERACGEIDRSASAFLPNLQPGEVVLLGVDFPIPMTVQIRMPKVKPRSEGADYQTSWNPLGSML